MFSQFGPLEIVLVIVVLLVIFGPKRLPSLGRQLGGGMREFKDSITGDRRDDDEDDSRPAIARAQSDVTPASDAQPADRAPEQRS